MNEKARAKAIELAKHILDYADEGHIDPDGDLCAFGHNSYSLVNRETLNLQP